jgi:hypothetical protein
MSPTAPESTALSRTRAARPSMVGRVTKIGRMSGGPTVARKMVRIGSSRVGGHREMRGAAILARGSERWAEVSALLPLGVEHLALAGSSAAAATSAVTCASSRLTSQSAKQITLAA